MSTPVLEIRNLEVSYAPRARPAIAAVREVSLAIGAQEAVGIVGESGCGKTQVCMAVMGLLGPQARTAGSVKFDGREILQAPPRVRNDVRGSKLTMVFQDPMTALTPHLTIGVQLAEVLVAHRGSSWREAEAAAIEMLERVRIDAPRRRARQYPHELSGGMRQRVMIGMSLLCQPALLLADEPTSALDVTVQAQIIALLRALRGEFGMALVLISHDIGVVAGLADRILVMYAGRIVESGRSVALLRRARHPYTDLLLKCVPHLTDARPSRMPTLPGQAPSPSATTPGCAFAPRCPRAFERCHAERPALRDLGESVQVACHDPLDA